MRMDPADRFRQLLEAALLLAEKRHYTAIGPTSISRAVGCSPGLVGHYFGTRPYLVATVLQEAINRGNTVIIDQARRMRDISGDPPVLSTWLRFKLAYRYRISV